MHTYTSVSVSPVSFKILRGCDLRTDWYLSLVVVLITKSVVTGQAPVTLELRNTPGKKPNNLKVVHAYITADAIHASTRNI